MDDLKQKGPLSDGDCKELLKIEVQVSAETEKQLQECIESVKREPGCTVGLKKSALDTENIVTQVRLKNGSLADCLGIKTYADVLMPASIEIAVPLTDAMFHFIIKALRERAKSR